MRLSACQSYALREMCGRLGLNVKGTSAENIQRVFDFQESFTTDDENNFVTGFHQIMFSSGTRIVVLPRQIGQGDAGPTLVLEVGGSNPLSQHSVLTFGK